MNILIGDIGNTITKICLLRKNNLKVKKITYFKSKNILSNKILKNKLNEIIKNETMSKFALFSSVVPMYQLKLKSFEIQSSANHQILNHHLY